MKWRTLFTAALFATSTWAFSPSFAPVNSKKESIVCLRTSLFAQPMKVAVVGGGWAGFSAATALSSNAGEHVHVTLLDASPRGPGGLSGSGWTTKTLNQTVEAGIHGFWREYRNTFAQMQEIGLDIDEVLTPFMPSVLVSADGRVAEAPVLGDDVTKNTNQNPILHRVAAKLPSPLDLALLADYDENSKISLTDRISAIGLLGVWADFRQEDTESWKQYNAISADQLFLDIAGISPRLYSQLVVPLLHVLPMSTGYDCSAAAALSCFHVFALQSKGAFDVRWCKGSISSLIFDPWVKYLQKKDGVSIKGSARLTSLQKTARSTFVLHINGDESLEVDAVIMAVGATAAKRLLPSCSELENTWNGWKDVKQGITCLAVRLILDRSKVTFDSIPPVTVCGPGLVQPILGETGFCVYHLSDLQKEAFPDKNWIVMEVDFFRANPLLALEDTEAVQLALNAMRSALEPRSLPFDSVLDYGIVRARDAVSHFSVGSSSPPTRLAHGLYMCGDWIDRSGHASWSTEKAVVTGKQAARALLDDFSNGSGSFDPQVVPAATDSPELRQLRAVASAWRSLIRSLPASQRAFPRPPWQGRR